MALEAVVVAGGSYLLTVTVEGTGLLDRDTGAEDESETHHRTQSAGAVLHALGPHALHLHLVLVMGVFASQLEVVARAHESHLMLFSGALEVLRHLGVVGYGWILL